MSVTYYTRPGDDAWLSEGHPRISKYVTQQSIMRTDKNLHVRGRKGEKEPNTRHNVIRQKRVHTIPPYLYRIISYGLTDIVQSVLHLAGLTFAKSQLGNHELPLMGTSSLQERIPELARARDGGARSTP